MKSSGIHHITAIASDPQRNLDFYAGALGLRLVKRTVNFDAPEVYHLYYGDELGRPGTILTFFPYPGAGRVSEGRARRRRWRSPFPRARSTSGATGSRASGSPMRGAKSASARVY